LYVEIGTNFETFSTKMPKIADFGGDPGRPSALRNVFSKATVLFFTVYEVEKFKEDKIKFNKFVLLILVPNKTINFPKSN
jgi:hypothetical protein